MEAFALGFSATGQVKQAIHKVTGVPGKDGYLTVGLHDQRPPARWAKTQEEIAIKWRESIAREKAIIMVRYTELNAMEQAGPIIQTR